ncbi:hypothetical protein RHGRI_014733 [Rhododendron griersonianum]|uniref:Uncharacterized protein n=1 Tax=Rhododendron griersonianum TaxID=479676 RepID=A0AAV6KAJ7_9ERIC|nr:hypothetical protein RHGRI_014733 [Rhododendron griersonianum]
MDIQSIDVVIMVGCISVRGPPVDNRDVVPYNAYLSRLFNCHINIEVYAGMRCVKYIHKYIYKGNNCATMVLGLIDEIKEYLNARYIGPVEAAWRLFGHSMHEEILTVDQNHMNVYAVNNILHDTFKSACIARGLLEDDEELVQCLEEATIMKTGYQLRRLFCVILTQCSPSQLAALWNKFAMHICDDLACKIQALFSIPNPTAAPIEDYDLYLLDELLQESGKNLKDFPPMPLPIGNWSVIVGNKLILEHQQLISDAQRSDANINVESLNEEQRAVHCNYHLGV